MNCWARSRLPDSTATSPTDSFGNQTASYFLFPQIALILYAGDSSDADRP
jgi:hypothetical protein